MPGLVSSARASLAKAAAAHPSVAVGLSGGKDSLATLALLKDAPFERVSAFFMYLVRGLRFVEDHVERVARMHGIELVYVPHPDLSNFLKLSTFAFEKSERATSHRCMRLVDVEAHVRKVTGAAWMADGQRLDDSLNRRLMLQKIGAVDERGMRLHPIWDWHEADVYAFVRARRLPLPVRLGEGRMSGFNLSGPVLATVKQRFPDDYRRVLEVFPQAEAAVFREELRAERAGRKSARG